MATEIKIGLYEADNGLTFKVHRLSSKNVYYKVAPVSKNQVQSMSILGFKKGLEKGKWSLINKT
jgi:hypothetical protein